MIPRIEALNELTRLSQELGMYDDQPMRICQPCRRILRVSDFGTNRERIPDKVCKECKLTERQKLLASRR